MINEEKKSFLENLPDLSEYYTESVLTDTVIMQIEHDEVEPVMAPTVEHITDRYHDLEHIAEGAVKDIYRVKDPITARNVAMAVIKDKPAKNQSECNRFIKEARIAANLQHPNIVPIHDIGVTSDNKPFFTMKLMGGENLLSIIRKLHLGDPETLEKYDLSRLLTIFQKICDALSFAHSKGIIHLDLKPENIQIGEFGEVFILDWGLAKLIKLGQEQDLNGKVDPRSTVHRHLSDHHYARKTVHGMVKGTPGYMSPEQAIGDINSKDHRTDIYSLGAILYSLLTYERPTVGETFAAIVKETISGEIIPPSKRAPNQIIPASLEAVTMKAMASDPDDRYQSVKALEDEINAFVGGFATLAQEASLFTQLGLMYKRHKFECLFILGSILTMLISFGIFFQRLSLEKDKAHEALLNYRESQEALAKSENRIALDRRREWQNVYTEAFAAPVLRDDWLLVSGKKRRRQYEKVESEFTVDNCLIMEKEGINVLYMKKRMGGDLRLEFDIKLGSVENSTVSCFLRSIYFKDNINYSLSSGYTFSVSTKSREAEIYKFGVLLSKAPLPFELKKERTYKIVAEKVGEDLNFSIDGFPTLSVKDEELVFGPEMTSLGIAVAQSKAKLDNIKIYQLGASMKVDLLKLGSHYINKGDLDRATVYLEEVLNSETSHERTVQAGNELKRVVRLRKTYSLMESYKKTLRKKIKDWNDNMILLVDDKLHLFLPACGLTDISFLKGMEINGILNLSGNPIQDISPISSIPTKRVYLNQTKVTSLRALRNMELELIALNETSVLSLAFLRGMPIKYLDISDTYIDNIDIITTFPLETIILTPSKLPSGWQNILKKCSHLKVIATDEFELKNGQKVEEFWDKYKSGMYN